MRKKKEVKSSCGYPKAEHIVIIDQEIWACYYCGNLINIEEYEKHGRLWFCPNCHRRCECDDRIDAIWYDDMEIGGLLNYDPSLQ
jgi:hypothetical protein